jgi:hypothetical protein
MEMQEWAPMTIATRKIDRPKRSRDAHDKNAIDSNNPVND